MKLSIIETIDNDQTAFVVEFKPDEVETAIEAIISAYMNLAVRIETDDMPEMFGGVQ